MRIRAFYVAFVFLVACGSSESVADAGTADSGRPLGGTGGLDDIDAASSWDEFCVGSNGCLGTQSCTTASCDRCECDNELAPDWTVGLAGLEAKQLAGAPDGSVYVLVAEEPWIVHYAAADGAMLPFNVPSTMEWGRQIAVGDSGSVFVGGSSDFGGSVETVQVQELSADGELLASARWASEDAAKFSAITTAADGSVWVAISGFQRGLFPAEGLIAARVEGDALVDPIGPFFPSQFSIEFDTFGSVNDVQYLAVGDTGDMVFGAASFENDAWLGFVADGTAAGGRSIAAGRDEPRLGGVASDGAGGWYWALGTGWENRNTGDGSFELQLERTSSDGSTRWSKYLSRKPLRTGSDPRSTCVVGLDDSVVFAVATTDGLEDDEPLFYVSRFGRDGSLAQTVPFEGTTLCARAGTHGAALLSSSGTLAHVTFPVLEIEQNTDEREQDASTP